MTLPPGRFDLARRHFLKTASSLIVAGAMAAPARVLAEIASPAGSDLSSDLDLSVKDYLHKMENFDQPHPDDVYLGQSEFLLLKSAVARFRRLQRTVGHGNFHLLSFDEAVNVARNYSRVGDFTQDEIGFLESVFYNDPSVYGFYGEKPVKNITDRIQLPKVIKLEDTGNYLYKGLPLETYDKIKRELGEQVVLTSGIRSVIKQFMLFLDKVYLNQGNLSLASRSLAPPGYSYHGISDFDVGQKGWGAANFTGRFVDTDVYKGLVGSGYLDLRYPEGNFLGVRFEPWHIRVK